MNDYGRVTVYKTGDFVSAIWEGAPLVLISYELMQQRDDKILTVRGNKVSFCGYQAKIVGITKDLDFIVERTSP